MKLQLYVLRQLLVALTFSVSGLLFVALPGIAVTTVHKLPGADAVVLMGYIPLVLMALGPYVLPLCFLLAVVATYGRLAADREWTAIQMAGVRPLKLLAPGLAVGLALGCGTYWMLTEQLPQVKQRQKALLLDASTSILRNLRPGRTSVTFDEFQLDAQWMDAETRVLHEVFIRRPGTEEEGNPEDRIEYHAKTAEFDIVDGVLHATLTKLFQFHSAEEMGQGYSEWIQFELPLNYLQKSEPSKRARFKTSRELRDILAAGEVDEKRAPSYRFEIEHRKALSATFLVFLGVGAPLGLMLRRGTQLGALATSSGIALLFYVLNLRIAKEIGVAGIWPHMVAAWSPTALGLALSVLLLRRALRR